MKDRITDFIGKVKNTKEEYTDLILTSIIIIAGAVFLTGLLRFSLMQSDNTPIQVLDKGNGQYGSQEANIRLIASKNGTKYYYEWCGGVGRIKEQNKVYFRSPEEAERAGYSLAKGCDGL